MHEKVVFRICSDTNPDGVIEPYPFQFILLPDAAGSPFVI